MTVWQYPPRVFVTDIIAETARVFRIPQARITGRSRKPLFAHPRFVCAYLARKLTPMSYPLIGSALGGRDHSTVMHAVRQAENFIDRDPEFAAYVDAVRIRLLDTRTRDERERQAITVKRARERAELARREREEAELAVLRAAQAEADRRAELDDMDHLSRAVAEFLAAGGSFVEARA